MELPDPAVEPLTLAECYKQCSIDPEGSPPSFVADALALAPPGIHVAASETVWKAAQGDVRPAVAAWLDGKIAST